MYRSLRSVTHLLHSSLFYQPPKSYTSQCFSIGQTPQKVPVLVGASTFPCNTCSLAHPLQHSKLHFERFSHFLHSSWWTVTPMIAAINAIKKLIVLQLYFPQRQSSSLPRRRDGLASRLEPWLRGIADRIAKEPPLLRRLKSCCVCVR